MHQGLILVCSLILSSTTAMVSAEKTNIILIMSDDQGYGDAGYLGNERLMTPHLDAMAERALQFDDFYAFSKNGATRAALLTGQHPLRQSATKFDSGPMNPTAFTLANAVKAKGYATAMYGMWSLSRGTSMGWYGKTLDGLQRKVSKLHRGSSRE